MSKSTQRMAPIPGLGLFISVDVVISKIKCQKTNKKFLEGGGILCIKVHKGGGGGSPPVLKPIAIYCNEATLMGRDLTIY